MIIIKRYPNRKLYDTEAKKYITLEGVADLIRQEQEVRVVDHTSGEDITAVTLTQIIMEKEKKQSGFLPRSVLTGLVQAGGNRLSILRQSLASPLALFRHIDNEIERRIQLLASRGELAEEEALRLRDKLLAFSRQEPVRLDESYLEQVLVQRGVPTKEDMQALFDQIETLSAKLDEMNQPGAND